VFLRRRLHEGEVNSGNFKVVRNFMSVFTEIQILHLHVNAALDYFLASFFKCFCSTKIPYHVTSVHQRMCPFNFFNEDEKEDEFLHNIHDFRLYLFLRIVD